METHVKANTVKALNTREKLEDLYTDSMDVEDNLRNIISKLTLEEEGDNVKTPLSSNIEGMLSDLKAITNKNLDLVRYIDGLL